MDESVIDKSLEMYTEITKVTTICIDSLCTIPPLSSKGLDISLIIKYADFDEIIRFLDNAFKQASETSKDPDTFHTVYTRNLFVYNIVFTRTDDSTNIALIAGPILTFFPSKKAITEIFINNALPLFKKYEFTGIINKLPLATNSRIYQLGKLLLLFSKTETKEWNSSVQKFHRKKEAEEILCLRNCREEIIEENDQFEVRGFYRFCISIMDKIAHGDQNGIMDIIGEYKYLFWDTKSPENNSRSLKNKCIIVSSLACNFAIQANVPYERMFINLRKSILKLERVNTENEIIAHMAATVEGFAYAVKVMSDNSYSIHINRVLQYIKNHFNEKITLKQLSEHIQVSPVYLSSLIKKETNMSLSTHVNLIRIEESKKLLIYTNKPIQEIAYDVGYNYQNHFNSVFKKLEGVTPLEYRNVMGRKNPILTL